MFRNLKKVIIIIIVIIINLKDSIFSSQFSFDCNVIKKLQSTILLSFIHLLGALLHASMYILLLSATCHLACLLLLRSAHPLTWPVTSS